MDRVWVVYQELIDWEDCPECGYEMRFSETEFISAHPNGELAEAKVKSLKDAGKKRIYYQSVWFAE